MMTTTETTKADPIIPTDWPVQPVDPQDAPRRVLTLCGSCGLAWDDAIATGMTPAPSGRCPFEPFHDAIAIAAFLEDGGYASMAEWMADSDFTLRGGGWFEDHNGTGPWDPEDAIAIAIEACGWS